MTAAKYLANRCGQLQNEIRLRRSKINEGTMCALLFVASLDEIEVLHPETLLGFCTRNECTQYLIRGEHHEVATSLLAKIIRKPLGQSTLAQRVFLSARYGLRDGIEIARDVVSDTSVPTYIRQPAILLMARFGEEEDRARLEPLLQDETVSNQTRNVQIRDVALAALIHMHGENVEDYGFANVRTEINTIYSAPTLGFETDDARAYALARWYQRHGK
jgi:hypothetical protein